jgi:DNA-binding CsgD family transcriptional regulator
VATGRGDLERARACYEASLILHEKTGDVAWRTFTLKNLGLIALKRGDRDQADALFSQALAGFREIGNTFGAAMTLVNMAKAARERGELTKAAALYRESLALRQDHSDTIIAVSCLRVLALVAALGQQYEQAARLFGAVETLRETIGSRGPQSTSDARALASAREALGESAFQHAWSAGRALSFPETIGEALAEPGETPEPAEISVAARSGLTVRELEVLRLLASGRSNPEIAAALFISRRTVTTHVTNLFAKLNAANRTEAVDLAHRRGLLNQITPSPT